LFQHLSWAAAKSFCNHEIIDQTDGRVLKEKMRMAHVSKKKESEYDSKDIWNLIDDKGSVSIL
jgi:hypothetical protein